MKRSLAFLPFTVCALLDAAPAVSQPGSGPLRRQLVEAQAQSQEPPSEDGRVKVRAPIVAAPEPPKVRVRMPVPPPEAMPVLSPTEAAVEAVRAWAAAWSDQRVEDYLSFYAPDFRPPNGLSRAAWEEQRRDRLGRPEFIRVTISSLGAEAAGEGTVRATFGQEYESDTFSDSVTKVLTLVERDGDWRILTEQATP